MATLPHRRFRPAHTALALALAAVVAGCASDDGDDTGDDTGRAAATGAVTVDNCGTDVTVGEPPQRVVTIKSTSTEMMLALGLGDRLVGTAFADGPLPGEYAGELDDVPVLSDEVPGQEALLDVEPDFVYGGWESNFSADTAGERSSLADFGITTYVSPAACQDPEHQPDPMTFDELFAEIHEVASFFGAADAADALVAEQQELLDQVNEPGAGQSALWFSSGEDAPFVGGDIGAPAMIMRELGLENIFADVDATWSNVSWEQVIDRDPDVIVLVDAAWSTADDKIERLETNPATAALPAVAEGHYLRLPFPASEAGVRNAQAVVDLAGQLAELER